MADEGEKGSGRLREVEKALRYAQAFERIAGSGGPIGEYQTPAEAMLDTSQNPLAARVRYYEDKAISIVRKYRPSLADRLETEYSEISRRFHSASRTGDAEALTRLTGELVELMGSVSRALKEIRQELGGAVS
ncbi:MAG: hypothetical protein ACE5IB_07290 [Candidatus Geothermarchaeales archaeon]